MSTLMLKSKHPVPRCFGKFSLPQSAAYPVEEKK